MDTGVRRARAVEVVCTHGPAKHETGSGYVLGDRLVLTAYHVVEGAEQGCAVEVRRLPEFGETPRMRAELVWPQTPPDYRGNPGSDVALLRVVDPAWRAPYSPLVVVGEVRTEERIPAGALGFPHTVMRPGEKRLETVGATGEIDPHHRLKSGMTAFFVKEPLLRPGSDPAAWKGFSGAAVFSGGCLVGVAVRHLTNPRDTLLECAPLTGLPELLGLLERAGAINQYRAEVDGRTGVEPAAGVHPVQVGYSPGRQTRLLRAAGLLLAAGALTAAITTAVSYSRHPEPLRLLLAVSLTALACLFGSQAGRLFAPAKPGWETLRDARLDLARAVHTTTARRRAELLGSRQRPIDLSFGTNDPRNPHAFRTAPGNRLTRIGEYFATMPRPQRLVITGGPGSGKTLLANELAHRLLGRPGGEAAIESVPVLVGLADWDPIGSDFVTWITTKLALEYGSGMERLYYLLLADGRITPVLDGLDEMDPPGSGHPRARLALEQLNRLAESADDAFPAVLTCRDAEEYGDLLTGGDRLFLGVTARINSVPPDAVLARLTDSDTEIDEDGWLWRALNAEGSPAGSVLSSPWMLALASAIRRPTGGEAALREIITASTTGDRREARLRSALLTAFIPSVCRTHRDSYRPEAVTRWLRVLTSRPHGGPGRSRDIAVHALWPVAGSRGRRAAAVLSVLCWLPVLVLCGLDVWWNHHPFLAVALPSALSLGPLIAARAAASAELKPRRIKLQELKDRTAPAYARIATGLLLGGLSVYPVALVTDPGYGLAFGCAFALVFGLGFGLAVRRSIDTRRMLLVGLPPAFSLGFLVALATWRYGGTAGVITGCGIAAVALALGVPPGVRSAQRRGLGQQRVNPPGLPTPLSLLRHDAVAGLGAGLITAGILAFGVGRVPFLHATWPWTLATAVAAGLAAGLGFVAGVTRQYLGVRLAMGGRLPWRLIAFLRWCLRSGLLRSAGTAYQLRHEELLDWLHRAD